MKKIPKTKRRHCQFKSCQCSLYRQLYDKRLNKICKFCKHGKIWHKLIKNRSIMSTNNLKLKYCQWCFLSESETDITKFCHVNICKECLVKIDRSFCPICDKVFHCVIDIY